MPDPADARRDVRPVPQWAELPDYAQQELASREYDADWFGRHAEDPTLRLTVLTLYVKLRGLSLWQLVLAESGSTPGCLHFHCADPERFKEVLRARGDFTNPGSSTDDWESRERRAKGALHFKHFPGWPETKVQAHIDPAGLLMGSNAWWLIPIVPLVQMAAHSADPEGYKDVQRVRELLLAQGWDPAPLTGRR